MGVKTKHVEKRSAESKNWLNFTSKIAKIN